MGEIINHYLLFEKGEWNTKNPHFSMHKVETIPKFPSLVAPSLFLTLTLLIAVAFR